MASVSAVPEATGDRVVTKRARGECCSHATTMAYAVKVTASACVLVTNRRDTGAAPIARLVNPLTAQVTAPFSVPHGMATFAMVEAAVGMDDAPLALHYGMTQL